MKIVALVQIQITLTSSRKTTAICSGFSLKKTENLNYISFSWHFIIQGVRFWIIKETQKLIKFIRLLIVSREVEGLALWNLGSRFIFEYCATSCKLYSLKDRMRDFVYIRVHNLYVKIPLSQYEKRDFLFFISLIIIQT